MAYYMLKVNNYATDIAERYRNDDIIIDPDNQHLDCHKSNVNTFSAQWVKHCIASNPDEKKHHPEEEQTVNENTTKGEAQERQRNLFENMDAIGLGVEARLEMKAGYSIMIAETTINIARKLGIPEDVIERWAASRLSYYTQKVRATKSILERL